METTTLEDRVTALEAELTQVKRQLQTNATLCDPPWWEQRFGAFADDPVYDEIVRLGREYRESLRPKNDEDEAL